MRRQDLVLLLEKETVGRTKRSAVPAIARHLPERRCAWSGLPLADLGQVGLRQVLPRQLILSFQQLRILRASFRPKFIRISKFGLRICGFAAPGVEHGKKANRV